MMPFGNLVSYGSPAVACGNATAALRQGGGCGQRNVKCGAASKAADLGGGRPLPSIARFGRLAYPIRGEATNRALLGCKRHGRPGAHIGGQRWERSGWQANSEA